MAFTSFPSSPPFQSTNSLTEKNPPVGADEIMIADSEDSYSSKKIQIANLPSGGGGGVEVGTIHAYVGTSAPLGYFLAEGQAVSRTTYAGLFAVIGTSFGIGDGSTTFNVPDLRGAFLRGVDNGKGLDPNAGSRTASGTGGNTGDAVGSYQLDAFKSHSHRILAASGIGNGVGPQSEQDGWSSSYIEATGGSETRPKNIAVNYIIKY